MSRLFRQLGNKKKRKTMRVSMDNYIETVPNYLLCPVCQEVFFKPIITRCGHTFCRECLFRWRSHNSVCPICRDNINEKEFVNSQTICEIVSSLRVHCKFKERGCTTQPMVYDYVKHNIGCQFSPHAKFQCESKKKKTNIFILFF